MKAHTNMDDLFSELGSVKKDRNREAVVELLTKKPETFQVEKPELSQVPAYNLLQCLKHSLYSWNDQSLVLLVSSERL